jgi:hypothetical protein
MYYWVCTIVYRADASAVEIGNAVGDSGGPFTYDEPEIVICVAGELIGAITNVLRDEGQ